MPWRNQEALRATFQFLGARNGGGLLRVVTWQEALLVLLLNSFSRAALGPQPL